jgi:hypothetical protein
MEMIQQPAPRWQFWVSILLLLWSLAGVAAFFGQYFAPPEAIAQLSAEEQAMWAQMPVWAWIAYAVAVGAGVLGAIGLLLRKRWAAICFAVSLAAVLIQFSYPFIIANGLATLGAAAMIFPAFIIFMAGFQWWLASDWTRKGWLK